MSTPDLSLNEPRRLATAWPVNEAGESQGASFEWPANVSPAQLARALLEEIACQCNQEFDELLSAVVRIQKDFKVGEIVLEKRKAKQGHPVADHSDDMCMSLEELAVKVNLWMITQQKLKGRSRGSGNVIKNAIVEARKRKNRRPLTDNRMATLVKNIREQLRHQKLDAWRRDSDS